MAEVQERLLKRYCVGINGSTVIVRHFSAGRAVSLALFDVDVDALILGRKSRKATITISCLGNVLE